MPKTLEQLERAETVTGREILDAIEYVRQTSLVGLIKPAVILKLVEKATMTREEADAINAFAREQQEAGRRAVELFLSGNWLKA